VGTPPIGTEAAVQLSHTHAKIWICYHKILHHTPDVYLGSANATDMTILDLMIKVNAPQARELITYFDELWHANTKLK
jgi:hypothetical protein